MHYYLLPLIFLPLSLSSEVPSMTRYYCVIGSGPSGLQMAYFLEKAGRDYLVFEQADSPGSFFKKYPRHRTLISKNQRDTGSTNKEYNLRYDLNSLISDDDNLFFTEHSKALFPTADELISYLHDYQQKLKLKVQFNTKINDIQYHQDAKNDRCRFTMNDQDQNLYCCRNVYIATGWQRIKLPDHIKGIEHVETYETISTNPDDYMGQTVLIIGRGFSGFETALSLKDTASDIHMASVSKKQINYGLQGVLRGVTNEILEGLDGFFELDIEDMEFVKSKGKIQVKAKDSSKSKATDSMLKEGYDRVILCLGFQWDDSIFHSSTKVPWLSKPGSPKDMYPDIGYDYQSKDFPGLYFIGPISHALDYRKSSGGGFIHGFRHTALALHRHLEWRNHGIKWPSVTKSGDQLVPTLLKRAMEGSGIYNSFGHLCDLAIYDRSTKQVTFLEEFPVPLIPHLLRNGGYEFNPSKHSAFVLIFQYGSDNADSAKKDAPWMADLHPAIYYYKDTLPTVDQLENRHQNGALPNPDGVHHIPADLPTRSADESRMHIDALTRFVEYFINEDLRTLAPETCAVFELVSKANDQNQPPARCERYQTKLHSVLMYD